MENQENSRGIITEDMVQDIRCPRCNKSLTDGSLAASEEVMQEYVRCLLGQRPFAKTVDLFGGALRLTFETMSAEQAEAFSSIIDNADIDTTRIVDIKMLATLKSVCVVDKNISATTELYFADYDKRLEFCKNCPRDVTTVLQKLDAPMLGALRKCAVTFDVLCATIKESIFTEDFYEGIGLL